MNPKFFAVAFVLTTPMFILPASAQAPSTEQFVQKVAISDLFEIETGRLASEQAEHEDVQAFADQMVEDHSETSEALKELVQDEKLEVELPKSLDEKHQAKLDKLKNLSGNEFDKTYISQQVQAHQTAVEMFENYAEAGENEDLKAWAGDTLPTLKEHLEDARSLNSELGEMAAADQDTRDKQDQSRKSGQQTEQQKAPAAFDYVKRQEPTDWSAEALIGRSVVNPQNESLGDINNVIVSEKGEVVAVTIGVGGFLGLGEKDVGVPFDALEFRSEKAVEDEENDATASDRYDSEHRDIQIVLNATKEQLERAPDFKWLSEQDE